MIPTEYWERKRPGQVKAIMLIHGLGAKDPEIYWHDFLSALKSDKSLDEFDIFVWKYPTHIQPSVLSNLISFLTKRTLRENAPDFALLGAAWKMTYDTQFQGYQDIVLVCHSMGGLIIKSGILDALEQGQSTSLAPLRHITFYAPPHYGAPITRRFPWNKQLKEMQPDGPFIRDLEKRWAEHILAWKGRLPNTIDAPFNYYIDQRTLLGINDEVVPLQYGTPHGMRPDMIIGDHSEVIHPKNSDDTRYKAWRIYLDEMFKMISPPAGSSGVWNVPYTRNPYFTGRDELLDQLHQRLTSVKLHDFAKFRFAAQMQSQVIKGLGGIGKTQIAVEYVYRSSDIGCYVHTLWINAATDGTMIAGFREIAELLPSFPAKKVADHQKLVEAIKSWLEQCEQRWLLIFDNADDLSLIHRYLPRRGNGSILLTTRADVTTSIGASLEVEPMGLVEGMHLLLRRAQRFEQASDEEVNEAGNIVIEIDRFPLALDQAGAYIEETRCSFTHYFQVYQDRRKALLAQRGVQTTNYPDSVATTWSLSFQKIEETNPAASELLRLCAFLAPNRIPEELIRGGAAYWPFLLQQAATDFITFDQMIQDLLKFSLIKRFAKDNIFTIHHLVQAVQMDRIEQKEQRQWAERTVKAVNKVFPSDPRDITTWPQCLRYLDQAQRCNVLIKQYMLSLIEAANLLNRTGFYLERHALYTIAEPLFKHALLIKNQQLGPEHFETTTSLHNLATLYYHQGKYSEAEPLLKRALSIRERLLGAEHPNIAQSLLTLAGFYQDQGKYSEAEPLLKRALSICERLLGAEHPDTAQCLNNLATLYHQQGRYTEAEPVLKRAILISDKQLGSEHLETATSLHNLAILYGMQGKYSEAEPLLERALSICERLLGAEHLNTAQCLNNLATLCRQQGKYAEAEMLYQRAVATFENVLGREHPDTRTIHENYDFLLQVMENDKKQGIWKKLLNLQPWRVIHFS